MFIEKIGSKSCKLINLFNFWVLAMGKEKLSKAEIEEMFQEGRLVARALQVNPLYKGKPKFDQLEDELKYLNVKKHEEGEHKNVERHGQRGRSATLLVPGVDMTLFDSVGVLYDADKSTIKAYMFRDSQTMSQALYDEYHNINIDKKKFEPIISRKEFMEKYRDYIEKINNPELRDNSKNYEIEQEFERYNEVLGNFFPESLMGIVGKDSSIDTKRNLLLAKNLLSSKHDQDVPMVLMDKGAIKVWNPDLKEIADIINASKDKIKSDAEKFNAGTPDELLKEFANNLGFTLDNVSFNTPITPEHLKVNNKYEFKANEIIDYLSEITHLPKGSAFTYGIEGRLLEVVNQRLENEGKERVKDLKAAILNKNDVENLVSLLDHEISTKDSNHKLMTKTELKEFSEAVVSNINMKRTGNEADLAKVDKLDSSKSSGIGKLISEFFNKVASIFKENVVTNKIEKFKNMKEELAKIKEPSVVANQEDHEVRIGPTAKA
ncbi:TPA: hypothetical protein F8S29_00535 [Legionella pneumophila]|nr:hypothetical protein [Legionella pneumophila]